MTVKFNSYSMWIEKKDDDDWYDWCVFVDENSDVVNSINSRFAQIWRAILDCAKLWA